jgi:DNA-binding XRE family transcriptional regulator
VREHCCEIEKPCCLLDGGRLHSRDLVLPKPLAHNVEATREGRVAKGPNQIPVTSAQVRMARAALNWTVRDLAKATGLHRNTINNFEVGRYAGDPETLAIIEKILVRAGVEFTNGDQPGVRLRRGSRKT